MEWLYEARWSPYVAGAGIGILSWFTFLFSNKVLGCSMGFSQASGFIEKAFRGEKVDLKPYYQKYRLSISWELVLLPGMLVGAFLSALISNDFQWIMVPDRWADTFGPSALPRHLTAIAGGVLMGMGARWAGGCTSGHGISGTMQLTLSSWIASICFFIGGIAAAFIIYHGFGA